MSSKAPCFCLHASDVRGLIGSQRSLFVLRSTCSKAGQLPKETWRLLFLWRHTVDHVLSPGDGFSSPRVRSSAQPICFFRVCTSRPWGSGWPELRKVTAGPVPLPNCVRVATSLLTLLITGKNTWRFSFAAILCFCVCFCSFPIFQQNSSAFISDSHYLRDYARKS